MNKNDVLLHIVLKGLTLAFCLQNFLTTLYLGSVPDANGIRDFMSIVKCCNSLSMTCIIDAGLSLQSFNRAIFPKNILKTQVASLVAGFLALLLTGVVTNISVYTWFTTIICITPILFYFYKLGYMLLWHLKYLVKNKFEETADSSNANNSTSSSEQDNNTNTK